MSELSKKDSDSDVDSNSSWTLLTEDANGDSDGDRSSEKNKQEKEIVTSEPEKNENTPKIKENELATVDEEEKSQNCEIKHENDVESLSSSSTCSLDCLPVVNRVETGPEQGCLTLDEYLTDKELSHDYDYEITAEFWEDLWGTDKRKKRKYKKCKADNLKTMTIIGAVFSLAGLSLLCMISPLCTKNSVPPALQAQIKKNFTHIETPYTMENNLKVYVDKSNKAMKLIDNVDILEPYIEQCCSNHIRNSKCPRTCAKAEKSSQEIPNERPLTLEDFLKESAKENRTDTVTVDSQESSKCSNEKTGSKVKTNEERKAKTRKAKCSKLENKSNQKQENPLGEKQNRKLIKKMLGPKVLLRELVLQERLEKSKHIRSNSEKAIAGKKFHIVKTGISKSDIKKPLLAAETKEVAIAENYGSFQNTFRKLANKNLPNFVLVDKHKSKQPEAKIISKIQLTEDAPKPKSSISRKLDFTPTGKNSKVADVITKHVKPFNASPSKKSNDLQVKPITNTCQIPPKPSSSHIIADQICDKKLFITCQILKDLCMLRLTSKLRAKEKSRQKKLKRRLERLEKRKSREAKVLQQTVVKEEEQEEYSRNETNEVLTNMKLRRNVKEDIIVPKPLLALKPKLVENHFLNEFKPIHPSKNLLSNFDLLKELPFMNEIRREHRECIIITRSQSRMGQKVSLKRDEPIPFDNCVSDKDVHKSIFPNDPREDRNKSRRHRFVIYNEFVSRKSTKFLEDARRKNEERLRLLEKMKQDNRSKINEIIRQRKERLKKDASLGIYDIPLPKYKDISEKLEQLKGKKAQNQNSFFLDVVSSSDSETEQKCCKPINNKISCELMTALKMGMKVSDTFREWTLKKAPTLTCLKNYCTSKVSQISERFSSQSMNQTYLTSSLKNEELETLKCRRERHEQLKKFWRAKQEYFDKRIEICELIKKKLSSENAAEKCASDHKLTQGVQILDSIIGDVLRSVKHRNSTHLAPATTLRLEDDVKKTSKRDVLRKAQSDVSNRHLQTYSANSDDLYNWLFEKRAMEIRRRDRSLFNVTKPGLVERKRDVSKHDSSRGYHEKIIKKHN